MFLKLFEKSFAQFGCFDKKIALSAVISNEHSAIEDILVHQPAAARRRNLESQAASADTFSLIAYILHALTADRNFQALQPSMETSPQLDLPALGSDGFGLKVEDDETGAGSVGNTYRNRALAWYSP